MQTLESINQKLKYQMADRMHKTHEADFTTTYYDVVIFQNNAFLANISISAESNNTYNFKYWLYREMKRLNLYEFGNDFNYKKIEKLDELFEIRIQSERYGLRRK